MGVGLCTSNLSSGFHSAMVACRNKDNSHFLSLLDKQPEIHFTEDCKLVVRLQMQNTLGIVVIGQLDE